MGRTKPVVDKDYVVGLTDGEGCFYVNVGRSLRYKSGFVVQLHFHIKMQEKDRFLLEKIKNTLDCGAVYFQKEQRANHTQCYRYTVSAKRDILSKVIPFFKKYPLQSTSKKVNFAIFQKIAKIVDSGRHLTKSGVTHIQKLKSTMNQKTAGLA